MWQNALDAFARYRLYILGAAGIVAAGVLTAVVVSVTDSGGGGDGPTRTPRATSTDATEPSTPTAATMTVTPSATATLAPAATSPPIPTTSNPTPTPVPPEPTATPRPTNTPRPGTTPTPEPFSITIVSPERGATVPRTFTIEIEVTGIELELGPGGQLIPGAGHWHVALDTSPPLPDPHDETSVQFGPVTPGLHTITALLNLNNADLTVVAIDQVQVMVAEPEPG